MGTQAGEPCHAPGEHNPAASVRPRPPAYAIYRQRLVDEVGRAATERLTCIAAPAGYGKTVLLAQWAATRTAGVAWVACDDRDVDLCYLARHLVQALGVPEAEAPGAQLVRGGRLLDTLVGAAAAVPDERVLVLSNVERLPSPALSAVATLITSSPEGLHFVVASRSDLLSMARAVGRTAEVTVITPSQLSFDRQEVEALAGRLGAVLGPGELDQLLAGTGGWPYGVVSVLRRYKAMGQAAALAHALEAPDRAARQYVWHEVLGQLPRPAQDTVVALAVPDAFSAPLADALTGAHDGPWVVDMLMASGLCTGGPRDGAATYSFRAFFRACLRSELRSRAPGKEEELYTRAANWHLVRGELLPALEYHLRAQHFERAAELLTKHALELYRDGLAPEVVHLALPLLAPLSHADQAAALCLAAMCLVSGETLVAERILEGFEREPHDDPGLVKWADGLRCLLIEYHAPAQQDVIARAGRILGLDDFASRVPTTDDYLRNGTLRGYGALLSGTAYLGGGQALAALDRHEEAWRWFKVGLADTRLPVELRAKLLGALARSEATVGQLSSAQRHAHQSLALGPSLRAPGSPELCEAYLALAVVALEQAGVGWPETAARLLDEAEARAQLGRRTNLQAEVVAQRARLFLLTGHHDDGLALLEGLRVSGNPDPPPEVAARLLAIKAELLVAAGQHAKAAYVLQAAPMETTDVLAVSAHLAIEVGDRARLAQYVRSWPDASRRPRARVLKLLYQAATDVLDGLTEEAHSHLDEATEQAGLEALNQVFAEPEVGGTAFRLLARSCQGSARSPDDRRAVPPALMATGTTALTDRELTVLRALATGLDSAALAKQLFISRNTLKTHLKHIYTKLGVTNRLQAVRRATTLGLLTGPEPAPTPLVRSGLRRTGRRRG